MGMMRAFDRSHFPPPEPECPVPKSHRRLQEAHRAWHQAAHLYSDPDGFRVNLNAAIQALRNVTFILQSEKHNIPSFDTWYPSWQQRMKEDNVLRWSVDARNRVVKQGDLETESVARVHVTFTWEGAQHVTDFSMPPSMATTDIIGLLRIQVAPEIRKTGILTLER